MKKFTILILIALFVLVDITSAGAHSFLFHATRRAAAKKIAAKGFSASRMKASARMGKGVYLTDSKRTALKEVPSAGAVVRFEPSKSFKNKVVDLRRPTPERIRTFFPKSDLRGAVKKQVIGPKLGRRLGKAAGRNGKVLRYRSAKDPKGSNYFIPQKLAPRQSSLLTKPGFGAGR
jgi:hypothetical protein